MMNENLWNIFERGLRMLNIRVDYNLRLRFGIFLDLYMKTISKFNISSIRNEYDVVVRHFLDSLSVIPILRSCYLWNSRFTYVDLGSGAGFPGIPLKLIEDGYRIDFAEVNKKKTFFLSSLINVLDLDSCVVDSSISRVGKIYDILLVRAFGCLSKIINESSKYGVGFIVAYKARMPNVLSDIDKIPSKYSVFVKKIECPFLDESRCFVIIKI